MSRDSLWEPGWQCGPPERPDEYTLVSHLHTGGEGEVWRASRRHRDGDESICALKILKPSVGGDSPRERAAWRERWGDSVHRRFSLEIPGLATPYLYFVGPVPRPSHLGTTGAEILYQVSPWYDGEPADRWARSSRADAVARADVLRALCVIVDRLHDLGYVHRDISGGNVLVAEAGQVRLIDITFLAPLERPLTQAPFTPGYAPGGEERHSLRPDPARDRFSVGAVARALLLPRLAALDRYDEADRLTHRQLLAEGYPSDVATCLVRALDPDPARRPAPLTAWAEELRALLMAARDAPHTCLDVLPLGSGHPLVVTGGPSGVRCHGLPGLRHHRAPFAAGSPRAVREVVCHLDDRGRPCVAAVDTRGSVWLGTADRWRGLATDARGVVALTTPGGPALLWTGHASGVVLHLWSAGADGAVRQVETPAAPADVLAAVRDREGHPCVLVGLPDSVELWTWSAPSFAPPGRQRVSDAPVVRGALALNVWGELEASLLREDGGRELWCDHFGDGWLCTEESRPADTGDGTSDVALTGDRRLGARADAGRTGITVSLTTSADSVDWHIAEPAHRVRLTRTADGRLLVAFLTDDGPRTVWEEWTGNHGPVRRLERVEAGGGAANGL